MIHKRIRPPPVLESIVDEIRDLRPPLPWPAVRAWLRSLASLRGADILRMKGILCIEDADAPIAVHGIQSMLHPPRRLKGWGGEAPSSRIVFIGRDLDAAGVNRALDAALAEHGRRHS